MADDPDGSYTTNDTIYIDVLFDKDVTVTGTPQLRINLGDEDRYANYSSGSGTDTLTFAYTLQAGDVFTQLQYVGTDALSLGGGTIVNGIGTASNLGLPSLEQRGIGSLGTEQDWTQMGDELTLTAEGVGSAVARVDFYIDLDGDGVGEAGEYLSSDSNGADGWTYAYNVPTNGLDEGEYEFLAIAGDWYMNVGQNVAKTVMIFDDEAVIIASLDDLEDLSEATSFADRYVLACDIDASDTVNWNSGAGFLPIGSNATAGGFDAIFDGFGHTISNLTINRTATFVGFFVKILSSAEVGGVGLINADINGCSYVGGLVGRNEGSISNCFVTGDVHGIGMQYIGGLVGYNNGTIARSYSTAAVYGDYFFVGGLAGCCSYGQITDCYATGSTQDGYGIVGGLIGYCTSSTVDNCYATGDVTGTCYVGGLIGSAINSNIYDSFAAGNVEGLSSNNSVGALIGSATGTMQLINNWYNEDATVTNNGTGGVNYDYADEATLEELAAIEHGVYNRSGSEWIFSGEDPVWIMLDLPELLL
ncbi:MAG: hypothetical protein JXB10_19435 [Pirellulales bacterium]|nr:hypothetical protein [Pirellulales bacterium]